MGEGVNIILLSAICAFLPLTLTQDWNTPPFVSGPPRPEVELEFDGFKTTIYMDEEILGDVYIAKLNYAGNGTPSVGRFTGGISRYLGAEVRQSNTTNPEEPDAWYLVVTNRQDYETPGMQAYFFYVDLVETEDLIYQTEVFVLINNIDDNPPIIHIVDTCEIPELFTGMTNCTYRVSDIDGLISIIPMYFTLEGRRNEEELFHVHEERFENTGFEMQFTLEIVKELDFYDSALHILTITAFDSLPNNSSVTIVVQVLDMPNMPPNWVSIFTVQRFDEKTTASFEVRAVDGDTQINKDIKYRLYKNETYTFFEIDEDTGVLSVDKIDRDALKQEVFSFEISAFKWDNITWETPHSVVIIVDDVNDNEPLPLINNFEISIDEETFLSLAFDDNIIFEDIDLGINAQYTVDLLDVEPEGASKAFLIIPSEGYQRQTFQITIVEAGILDFDDVEWQTVRLMIKAQERLNPEHVGYANVTINLINWNDEVPIFEQESYEVVFLETVGAGHVVATIKANDRDIDDVLHYTISGSVAEYLSIDLLTGVITVTSDNAFDYQRQNEIIVQVRVRDTLGNGPRNTVFAQLTINLIDVNNKQPQINPRREIPSVEENVPDGHVISDNIFGSDPDTTANITYSINWDESYATKLGRPAASEEFVGTVEIMTVYPNPDQLGYAQGILIAREIRENVTIDFEEFEVLYLVIRLTDHNQEIGDDYSENMITILIEDMNDNPPVWVEGTLEAVRVVREKAETGVIIGSVQATDIDGPLYNNVTYWLFPNKDTPDGLVQIDPLTGQLSVDSNRAIDADVPRYHLYYIINATDCCFYPPQCGKDPTCYDTLGEIEINIIDINDKIPIVLEEEFETEFWIYENATTGEEIGYILAADSDRDDIYHTVAYDLNYREHQNLRLFFAIEQLTGKLFVDLTTDQVLDRDRGVDTHYIYIILTDNHLLEGDRTVNTNFTEVTVRLLDVNDNAPELPHPSTLTWPILENVEAEYELSPSIYAPDIDEPNTDNSRVNYEILDLTLVDRSIEYPEDLFGMRNPNNVTGHLFANYDLKGYWGTWDIWIRAHDYGHPRMSSNETYQIVVNPYNFHDPVFTFPREQSQIIRLSKERAVPNVILYYTNNVRLDNIHATDEDGLTAGIVTFAIVGNDDASEYFIIQNEGSNTGTLVLTKEINDDLTSFEMTIRATDQGTDPGPRFTDITVTVQLTPTQGDPVFENSAAQVSFTEFGSGLEERQQLPLAVDPKNGNCEGDDCFDVFYYIFDGDTQFFELDRQTNVLRLSRELNRSESVERTLRVVSTNSANQPESVPNFNSILNIIIEVKDSDPKPIFTSRNYTGGITITDPIDKELLTIQATHTEREAIKYDILWDTMEADPTLQSVVTTAFQINNETGLIRLNFQQQASMTGLFKFQVMATDESGRNDQAEVIIYLVGDDNRVVFRFFNVLTKVEEERQFIETTLTTSFEMICNVDWIIRANDADGTALEDLTDVRVHFILDDVAVEANAIELKHSDISFMRSLREALLERSLLLNDLNIPSHSDLDGLDTLVRTVLIVLAALLALICVALAVAYFVATRRLKNRLEKISNSNYGNVDDGLKKAGQPASMIAPGFVPGTNRHAVEGSNPVWNESIKAPDFDALSEISGDSDLIGIEENPQFGYENRAFEDEVDRVNGINQTRNPKLPHDNPSSSSYFSNIPNNTEV